MFGDIFSVFLTHPTDKRLQRIRPLNHHFCSSHSHTHQTISSHFSHVRVAEMLGHTDRLSELRPSKDQILADSGSEFGDDDEEEKICSEQILYSVSFEELASNSIKYDTVIWLSISLLLILAWGVGLLMLLYLPFRRYVLRKDFASRRLYVTQTEIAYKVSRPSFIPFWGTITIERSVPLSLVIDIIIEQGCVQSIYGVHTFRIESIAHGKAAPVDELQLQGISDPGLLRKVIVTEASKISGDLSKSWRHIAPSIDVQNMACMPATAEKIGSSRSSSIERRIGGGLLLNKLEEISKSVKRLELLIEKSHGSLAAS
ncbi:unnamed protein product [Vicia faba]|uniref:DUF7642 domain-containing protein n=1 Tax=Vicia faba TaxID=3906 RepID=A0AAV1ARL1_VICFA|nr:unnamed protein product [Vicia faba]